MKFEDLSDEHKQTVKDMVKFCLEQCYKLGMDEGFDYDDDLNPTPNEERKALTEWVKGEEL